MIAVFAYAFAHRKTHDFLVELALAGHRDVVVIAAPAEPLAGVDRTQYFTRALKTAPAHTTKDICAAFGFDYHEMPHRNVDDIAQLAQAKSLKLGIISGARILKRGVIEAFDQGIVNFHPGSIPETSGLDAFFYTLKTGVDAGVTTHFIDPRVDAGDRLYFDAVQISTEDTPETVQDKGYHLQIIALRRFLSDWGAGTLDPQVIHRPAPNLPMTPDEKWATLLQFPKWRAARGQAQTALALQAAAKAGELGTVQRIVAETGKTLLEGATPQGWTPLILAAHAQHADVVQFLLDQGANPNATGTKGTTVLMYAKTALMGQDNPDTTLLDILIVQGADPTRCDMYGKPVLDYVAADSALIKYFKSKGA